MERKEDASRPRGVIKAASTDEDSDASRTSTLTAPPVGAVVDDAGSRVRAAGRVLKSNRPLVVLSNRMDVRLVWVKERRMRKGWIRWEKMASFGSIERSCSCSGVKWWFGWASRLLVRRSGRST